MPVHHIRPAALLASTLALAAGVAGFAGASPASALEAPKPPTDISFLSKDATGTLVKLDTSGVLPVLPKGAPLGTITRKECRAGTVKVSITNQTTNQYKSVDLHHMGSTLESNVSPVAGPGGFALQLIPGGGSAINVTSERHWDVLLAPLQTKVFTYSVAPTTLSLAPGGPGKFGVACTYVTTGLTGAPGPTLSFPGDEGTGASALGTMAWSADDGSSSGYLAAPGSGILPAQSVSMGTFDMAWYIPF